MYREIKEGKRAEKTSLPLVELKLKMKKSVNGCSGPLNWFQAKTNTDSVTV